MKKILHNPKDVGGRVQKVRNAARLRQHEMATILGMSTSNYSKIEVGARQVTRGVLALLHRDFGVDSTWLLTGEGIPPSRENKMATAVHPIGSPFEGSSATKVSVPTLSVAGLIDRLAEMLGVDCVELKRVVLEYVMNSSKGNGKHP